MEFKAVEFMRGRRDKISADIKDMSWEEESKYLKQNTKSFDYIISKKPSNKSPHKPGKTSRL